MYSVTCKLCGALIEVPPDRMLDEGREQRARNVLFNRIAAHIDPKTNLCTANNKKLIPARFTMTMQDNGWFQRWRLLACCNVDNPALLAKSEEWRQYLHTITLSQTELDALALAAAAEQAKGPAPIQ